MKIKSFSKSLLVLCAVLLTFLGIWYVLAANLTAWSDEITHLTVGKGLLLTGRPYGWNFDQGSLTGGQNTRGLLISHSVKFVYRMLGETMLDVRLIPLGFTLLTFLLFVGYISKRHKSSIEHICLVGILFFGQSLILEKSLYVRFYAPLAFFVIAGLICYWEGLQSFKKKQYLHTTLLWSVSAGAMALPSLDDWQIQHIPIFLLALMLSSGSFVNHAIAFLKQHAKKVLFSCILFFLMAPFLVLLIDILLINLTVGSHTLGISFVTYWDNIMGLIRYTWALNIVLMGTFFLIPKGKEAIKWDFFSWLYSVGLISGIAFGLLNPHNFIFYSRFFYLPVVLTVLGFSGLFLKMFDRSIIQKRIIITYLCLNFILSYTTFYYDRSNIVRPIQWLNTHLDTSVLLTFSSELELHRGKTLIHKAHPIIAGQDVQEIRRIIDVVAANPSKDVYFLYTDHYQLREALYRFTTGKVRTIPGDFFRHLKDVIPGEKVIGETRGCGLLVYQKENLILALTQLLDNGYPKLVEPISAHKRILKKLFAYLGLPDTREEIMAKINWS